MFKISETSGQRSSRWSAPCRALAVFMAIGAATTMPVAQAVVTYPSPDDFLSGSIPADRPPGQSWGNPNAMPFRYLPPPAYNPSDTATKYPLVIHLHGSGEGGNNVPGSSTYNKAQLNNNAQGGMIFVATSSPNNRQNYPCFFVAPQLQSGSGNWWSAAGQIPTMINYFLSNFNVDADRIYIEGYSLGGQGTLVQLSQHSNLYAAAAAMCPVAESTYAAPGTSQVNVPLWDFHSQGDSTVLIADSDNWPIKQARRRGWDPIYSRYINGGHGTAWSRAYSTSTPLVAWMFAQRRGQPLNKSVGPYVNITAPTTNASYTTGAASITLSGSAGDSTASVSSLQWYNYSADPNPNPDPTTNGTVTGTNSWTATIPLQMGANQIQIRGTGLAYAATGNGNTTFSDTITITRIADTTAPNITITTPSSASATSFAGSYSFAGTASDNVGVTSVTWSNDRGGSGTATGTNSWTASITLAPGINNLTFKALDGAGNTKTANVTVAYHRQIANGLYTLTPTQATGLRLDASGAGGAGTSILTYTPNNWINQKWQFTSLGNGRYKLQPSYATGAGGTTSLALSVPNNVDADVLLNLGIDNDSTGQQWFLASNNDGTSFKLIPACASGRAMGATGNATTSTTVGSYVNNGQSWTITATS